MIVWCQLCETNPVDVHPDDALHESFEGATCDVCSSYPARFILGWIEDWAETQKWLVIP